MQFLCKPPASCQLTRSMAPQAEVRARGNLPDQLPVDIDIGSAFWEQRLQLLKTKIYSNLHHNDVIKAQWRLKSPASRLFTQPFIKAIKKTSKLRITGLCEGNSPVTGEFPAQRASNAKNVSIWWCHYVSTKKRIAFPHVGFISNCFKIMVMRFWEAYMFN